MWLEKSVMYPALHATIRDVLVSDDETKVQFIMEPLAFPEVAASAKMHGMRFIEQLAYLTRTFAFYMRREYDEIKNSLKNNPPPPPEYPDINPSLISADPDHLARPTTSSTCGMDCPAQLTSPLSSYHHVVLPVQSVLLTDKPCYEGPGCVGPVTTATLTSTSSKLNHSIYPSTPNSNMLGGASIPCAINTINTVKQVVLST